MFYYLTGKITILEPNLAVVDCGGVGYACHTTAHTIAQLRLNQEHRLYTYCNIREDAFDIFGFATRDELQCFELLMGVSGVGPKAALSLLSAVPPDRLTLAIMTDDAKALTAAQGVGKKMAQRVILELKDKIGKGQTELDFSAPAAGGIPASGGSVQLATAALAELGYSQAEIGAALKGIAADGLSVEELVRQALRAMVLK